MGLIEMLLGSVFGGGRNVVKETAEIFRENAEAGAQRDANASHAALSQFSSEFYVQRKGWFDRFMDGLNRLPRPLMVIGVFALFAAAMFDPLWFAERMQGLALVPAPLWWFFGVIVSFYFGARHQYKGQEHQRAIAQTMARTPQVLENIKTLREMSYDSPGVADTGTDAELTDIATQVEDNPAVLAWRASDRVTV